jgi:hypothetical protein
LYTHAGYLGSAQWVVSFDFGLVQQRIFLIGAHACGWDVIYVAASLLVVFWVVLINKVL